MQERTVRDAITVGVRHPRRSVRAWRRRAPRRLADIRGRGGPPLLRRQPVLRPRSPEPAGGRGWTRGTADGRPRRVHVGRAPPAAGDGSASIAVAWLAWAG